MYRTGSCSRDVLASTTVKLKETTESTPGRDRPHTILDSLVQYLHKGEGIHTASLVILFRQMAAAERMNVPVSLPVLRNAAKHAAASRFAHTPADDFASEMPLANALQLAAGNPYIVHRLAVAIPQIKAGALNISERTASLEEVLREAAALYAHHARESLLSVPSIDRAPDGDLCGSGDRHHCLRCGSAHVQYYRGIGLNRGRIPDD